MTLTSKLRLNGISGKLYAAFAIVILLMGALTAFSIYQIEGVRAKLTEINEVNSRLQRYAINYRGSVHDRAIAIRDVVLSSDPQLRGTALQQIEELAQAYAENEIAMADLTARVGLPEEKAVILNDIAAIQSSTNPLVAEIIELTANGQTDAAQSLLLDRVSGLFSDWLAAINRFIDAKEADNQEIGAEVATSVQNYALTATIAMIVAATMALAAGAIVSRSITRPIGQLVSNMSELASGNLQVTVAGAGRSDEVGNMARAVKVFQDNMLETERLRADQLSEQKLKEERQANVEASVAKFDQSASTAIKTVTGAVKTLKDLAETLNRTADETTDQSARVSAASEDASSNVQSVALSAENLSNSIREISDKVSQSAAISQQAVTSADETTSRVQSLAEAANRIGDVVNLISDIAEQTNLLALNATIEAARAGEAGKGFAVVASEVKSLAEQTAKATTEIGQQISTMQDATDQAVSAIDGITGLIKSMDENATLITASVTEQGTATGEISNSVQVAARGAQDVTDNIGAVSETAKRAGEASTHVLSASAELGTLADDLRRDIDQFLASIKAA